MSEGGVIAATGCKPNCHRDKYNVEQMYYETLTDIPGYEWLDGKRVAKVSFAYAGASYEEDTEYFAYDEKVDKLSKITSTIASSHTVLSQDFLGDFGGNLGLCLGWSLLDAYGLFTPIFKALTHVISGGTKKF